MPAGVVLRGLAADWYVRADRYILAYLVEIARLAFAARFRATLFATASHITYVCNLLNKFLTEIQTIDFTPSVIWKADISFKWSLSEIRAEPHAYFASNLWLNDI